MNTSIQWDQFPELEHSRTVHIGRRLLAIAMAVKTLNGPIAAILMMIIGVASVSAQTPTGSFFQRQTARNSVIAFACHILLAAAMIIAELSSSPTGSLPRA